MKINAIFSVLTASSRRYAVVAFQIALKSRASSANSSAGAPFLRVCPPYCTTSVSLNSPVRHLSCGGVTRNCSYGAAKTAGRLLCTTCTKHIVLLLFTVAAVGQVRLPRHGPLLEGSSLSSYLLWTRNDRFTLQSALASFAVARPQSPHIQPADGVAPSNSTAYCRHKRCRASSTNSSTECAIEPHFPTRSL